MTLKAWLDDGAITEEPDGMKTVDLVALFKCMPLDQLRGDDVDARFEGNRIYLALLEAVPDYLLGEDGLKARERARETAAGDKAWYDRYIAPYLSDSVAAAD